MGLQQAGRHAPHAPALVGLQQAGTMHAQQAPGPAHMRA